MGSHNVRLNSSFTQVSICNFINSNFTQVNLIQPLFVKVTLCQKMSVFGLRHNCIGPKAATWSNFVALLKRGVTQVFNFIINKKRTLSYSPMQNCNVI